MTTIISTGAEAEAFLAKLREAPLVIAMDTETSGLDPFGLADRYKTPLANGGPSGELVDAECGPARICGLSVALKADDSYYLPFRHEDTTEPQLPLGWLKRVITVCEETGKTLVFHNAKFDLRMLFADGCLPDRTKVKVHDTMILAHVLQEDRESFTLASLTSLELGISTESKSQIPMLFKTRKYRRYSQFPIAELGPYAGDDVENTLLLWHHFYPHLVDPLPPWWGDESQAKVFDVAMDLLWVLLDMECQGIRIDLKHTEELWLKCFNDAAAVQVQINEFVGEAHRPQRPRKKAEHLEDCPTHAAAKAGCTCGPVYENFLVNSHAQLTKFYAAKGWPVPKNPKDPLKNTFNDALLLLQDKKLNNPEHHTFVDMISRYRAAVHFGGYYSSYLKLADKDGYLHPNFNQHGTVTGRLSGDHPNLQNVPKAYATGGTAILKQVEELIQSEIRTVFIPCSPEHVYVSFDYSQQEVRLFLHYAEEPAMREIVMTPGKDVHHHVALLIWGLDVVGTKGTQNYTRYRHWAKAVTFGILYGMGKQKLADAMEVPLEKAKEIWDTYMQTFPGVKTMMDKVSAVAGDRGYIRNAFGRRRRMRRYTQQEISQGYVARPNGMRIRIWQGQQYADLHKALNSLIQGGCADLTKIAMIRCAKILEGTRSHMVNQVHDDLLFELHVDEADELIPRLQKALEEWKKEDGTDMFRVPFFTEMKRSPVPGGAWSTVKETY